jgi:hypothetical protein
MANKTNKQSNTQNQPRIRVIVPERLHFRLLGRMLVAQFGILREQLDGTCRRLIGRQLFNVTARRTKLIVTFNVAATVDQLIKVAFDQLFRRRPFHFVGFLFVNDEAGAATHLCGAATAGGRFRFARIERFGRG